MRTPCPSRVNTRNAQNEHFRSAKPRIPDTPAATLQEDQLLALAHRVGMTDDSIRMPEDEMISGTTLIRRALNTRNRKVSIAVLARELDVSVVALELFATDDEALLPPRVLDALAKRLLGGSYDAECDVVSVVTERS
jgi:hypothetical protein